MENNDLTNSRLGKYQVQDEIGRGGMGSVYRGYDPMLDRYVAIKVLAPHLVWQKEFVERLLREARAAARVRHPNIVTIHDIGQEAGWYFFVMEYLDGHTLTEYIRHTGPMSAEQVLSILRPLASALDYAHDSGLVHRDIKPGNIIIGPRGQVTLTDFGIARAAQETRLTNAGAVVGTPDYMSPEQAQGFNADTRSDQYSLAVVAFEMLSGKALFKAENTLALLYKVVHESPVSIHETRPDLPPGVAQALERALAKQPDARYPSISAFVETLAVALAGETVATTPPPEQTPTMVKTSATARPPTPLPEQTPTMVKTSATARPPTPAPQTAASSTEPATPGRKPPWAWALAGLAALALLVGGGLALSGNAQEDAAATLTSSPTSTATSAVQATITHTPSKTPTRTPSRTPTRTPSRTPARTPSRTPTRTPSRTPTRTPSRTPTHMPTTAPTITRPPATQQPTQPPPTQPPPTQSPPTQAPPTQPPPTQSPPTQSPPTQAPPTQPPPTEPPPPPPTEPPPPPPTEPPPPPPTEAAEPPTTLTSGAH